MKRILNVDDSVSATCTGEYPKRRMHEPQIPNGLANESARAISGPSRRWIYMNKGILFKRAACFQILRTYETQGNSLICQGEAKLLNIERRRRHGFGGVNDDSWLRAVHLITNSFD